jgi:hypothetical protein
MAETVLFQGSPGTFTGPPGGPYVLSLAPGWTSAEPGAISSYIYTFGGVLWSSIEVAIVPGEYGTPTIASTHINPALFPTTFVGDPAVGDSGGYWPSSGLSVSVYADSPLLSGDGANPVWAWTNITITALTEKGGTVTPPVEPPVSVSSGKLIKDTKTTYTPGSPGTPGTPGSPGRPAYYTQETVNNDVALVRGFGAEFYVPSWFTVAQIIAQSTNPGRFTAFPPTRTVTTLHPAVPAVAPTPGTPGTVAQTTHDFNIGWNSGAVSKQVLSGDCDFTLSVAPSSVGIVAGLNSGNEGTSYREIDHGLYFSRGGAIVYEAGSAKTAAFAFTATDNFTVRRSGSVVTYLKNADVLYTSAKPSVGPVFADASLYMGGDTISAAAFTAAAIQYARSAASFLPLDGLSSDKAYTSSRASLPALTSEAYSWAHGSSYGTLPALAGTASNKAYAESRASLHPLTTTSTSGELAPSYAISAGSLAYLLGAAHSLTGEVGSSAGSFEPLGGLSADRPYAAATGSLQPLGTFSTFIIPPAPGAHASAALTLPALKLTAAGHDSTGESSFAGKLPALTLRAYGGANAKLRLPAMTLAVTATSTNWAKAALVLPALTAAAGATTGGVASADLVIRDAFRLVGYSGAVCAVTIGGFTIAASGTTGATGRAALTLPLFELQASGTAQNYGRAELLLPALQAGATAQAWLTLPGLQLTAIGTAVVTATYEAYSINLNHTPRARGELEPVDQVTRYTNFPFTQIVRYQNSYFGVAADGLYLLEGTTDDGAPIAYAVKTAVDDLKVAEKKIASAVYLAGRIGPTMAVALHAGETGAESYAYNTPRGAGAQNHREKFGRGIKDRYFAVGLSGTDTLELDSIELEINKLNRRI